MRKSLYILGTLDDTDVTWIARHSQKHLIPPGSILIREGEPVDSLFIILDGQLSVETRAGEVARLLAGDIVGEISFVDSRPPLASVVVTREALILSLRRDVVTAKIEKDCHFAARFYRAVAIFLADRLRTTTGRTAGVSENGQELDSAMMDNAALGAKRFQDLVKTASAG